MGGIWGGLKRRGLELAGVTGLGLGAALASAAAQTPGAPPATIAVLPLENNSGDAKQDFFAGGMTDEIAAALTGVRGLDVVARSSSFRLPPELRDTKAIGHALNATYLVQGSARMADERVRVSIRLLQAGDGAALWSKDYDAALPAIFDLEEDIAEKIAATLQMPTNAGEKLGRNRTGDFDASLAFWHAKVAARERGAKALADAAVFLEQSLARDPDFAPACAMLAYVYALTPLFAPSLRGGMPDEERKIVARTIPRSDALARHATQLDPKGADGFVGLAYAEMVQRKMLAAEDAFTQPLALNPHHPHRLHAYTHPP